MTNSEANVTSDSSGFVSESLRSSTLLGFAHADTLAAMRRVSPVPAPFAQRLPSSSVPVPVRLPGALPPAPQPQFVSQPQPQTHSPPHAAGWSAASVFTRRSALSRRAGRESERTPNHALQRTAPRVTVAANSGPYPSRPCVALSYVRCLFLRLTPQLPRHAPPSLSLGSLGDATRFLQFS